MARRTVLPLEQDEQIALVEWASWQRIPEGRLIDYLVMIPNESLLSLLPKGHRRFRYWERLKRMGFTEGAADLQLALPRAPWPGLWIEMKRQREAFGTERAIAAAVSENQSAFGKRMQAVGYQWVAAYGWEEARDHLLRYLG